MNPFEAKTQVVIPAVLIYAFCKDEVLMIQRTKKKDQHLGKYNGIGGKCELNESFFETAVREFHEETGLLLTESLFRTIGILQFPNFKPDSHQDWLVTVFRVDLEKNQVNATENPEGILHWIRKDQVNELPLWEGDHLFLPNVFSGRPFIGTLWYESGTLQRHQIREL